MPVIRDVMSQNLVYACPVAAAKPSPDHVKVGDIGFLTACHETTWACFF
jgi:hypothetical protein